MVPPLGDRTDIARPRPPVKGGRERRIGREHRDGLPRARARAPGARRRPPRCRRRPRPRGPDQRRGRHRQDHARRALRRDSRQGGARARGARATRCSRRGRWARCTTSPRRCRGRCARCSMPTRRATAIFSGVLDALRHETRPTVVVIEDVHWADERMNAHHYMRAWQALIRMYQGRWRGGGRGGPRGHRGARRLERRPDHGARGARAPAHASGRSRRRRGARRGARAGRADGYAAAPGAGAGGARGGRLAGRRSGADAALEARAVYDLALHHRHAWHTAELRSGGGAPASASPCRRGRRPPFALQLRGDWRRAAAAGAKLGCPLEHGPRARGRRRRRAGGSARDPRSAGRAPAADALRKRLRAEGVRRIPRGPRPTTRAHPFGLTSREMEILEAVATGLSNARSAIGCTSRPRPSITTSRPSSPSSTCRRARRPRGCPAPVAARPASLGRSPATK